MKIKNIIYLIGTLLSLSFQRQLLSQPTFDHYIGISYTDTGSGVYEPAELASIDGPVIEITNTSMVDALDVVVTIYPDYNTVDINEMGMVTTDVGTVTSGNGMGESIFVVDVGTLMSMQTVHISVDARVTYKIGTPGVDRLCISSFVSGSNFTAFEVEHIVVGGDANFVPALDGCFLLLGGLPCPVGSFSNQGRGCDLCPEGFFTDETGQYSCQPCELGEFQDEPGQTGCNTCPPGTYSSSMGSITCTPCRDGKTSEAGATSEDQCVDIIPALSDWGMFILALSLITLSMVGLRQRKLLLS